MENRTKCVIGAMVVLLGVGVSSQLTSAEEPAAGSQRKFTEVDVLERNAIKNEIAKKDLPQIFQAMLDAERVDHDSLKQMQLQTVLSGALRTKTPSPEFLEQMRVFITDESNSKFERHLLIGALESAATKATVDLLIQIATTSRDLEMRQSAGALAGVGNLGRGGEELLPSLERVWRESREQNLLISTASSMAKIGAPSGVELLLTAALPRDGSDYRQAAAQSALREIYLPKAVPPLAARLVNQPFTSATAKLVVPILVNIGDATAAKTMVSWLQVQDDDAATFVRELIFQQIRTPAMLDALDAALEPAVLFHNEQNRAAIRAGLTAYREGHK